VEKLKFLGGDAEKDLKEYGYGSPLRVDYTVEGKHHSAVLSTIRPGGFGHDTMPDRAGILFWETRAFNELPRHVRSIDLGSFTKTGGFKSLGDCTELFMLRELVDGKEYAADLNRIRETGELIQPDLERTRALARYLADIHREKRVDPGYYERRTRELLGHNECLFGLTDSYPADHPWIRPEMLADIEKACVDWRWRLKTQKGRLSVVHGDFHPFNILFREGADFSLLDRSRGSWGEPADDLAALSINYLFWGLLHRGEFADPFRRLWREFYSTYLTESQDVEVLQVVPPYLTWRALVVASPVWYKIDEGVRRKLINFSRNVLDHRELNWMKVEPLLEDREWP
jgi:hypothetical protein